MIWKVLKDKTAILTIITALASGVMIFIPTGFEQLLPQGSERVKVLIEKVDNATLRQHGIVKTGAQRLTVEVLDGSYAGRKLDSVNHLMGKMEMDKVFSPGDTALAVLNIKNGEVNSTVVIDHYRLNVEIILFFLFFVLVLSVAGKTGIKAMVTFIFAVLFMWKILLPAYLRGWDPILTSLGSVMLLTGIVIFSVAGFSRRGLTAFLGAFSGVLLTCILSVVFGKFFKIHGAVQPFSESLLYTGFPFINLTGLFYSGIFIAASGVIMDISMDIAASMNEVKDKKPDIGLAELAKSGLEVGRAVIGTMTTTLLLAYFGGYSSMFMLFIAMGTPVVNILNMQYVSAEILHILVGSFGLITVAPLTAYIGGIIFSRRANNKA